MFPEDEMEVCVDLCNQRAMREHGMAVRTTRQSKFWREKHKLYLKEFTRIQDFLRKVSQDVFVCSKFLNASSDDVGKYGRDDEFEKKSSAKWFTITRTKYDYGYEKAEVKKFGRILSLVNMY